MLRALLVDDEKKARQTLRLLLESYCEEVQVLADFGDTLAAERFIKENPIDILFLDVEMKGETGLQLAERLTHPDFKIVLVTAHPHYAIKAIKFQVFDYLLKPVDVSELIKTVNRCRNQEKTENHSAVKSLADETLEISSNSKIIFLKQNEISYIKADGSYSEVYVNGDKKVVSKNLSELSRELSDRYFFRVHHSYIVNVLFVKAYDKSDGVLLMKDGVQVSVSRRRRDEFLSFMRSNS